MANKGNPTLPIPVDFIDLTQDSPINLSRRENKNPPILNNSTRRLLRNRGGYVQELDKLEYEARDA
ncbi:uncharacterized protein LOC117181784 isoform X2 [Belonocnema kinseyi]|uniref:uncharacterized protein LOC117181784 isoform X2 n=1 Tax=Belonocnema kinseyi TaxID=2817044 RepID=UPI00143D5384|nr:uncharacterized protein LOC117181784 isoform X2 [Belonocnema kinseyi]